MMPAIDIAGRVFGRLTALHPLPVPGKSKLWLCRCECGAEKIASSQHLRRGQVRSCGCWRKDFPACVTHGQSKSRIYRIWVDMRRRCDDPSRNSFPDYGGRGIGYDPAWNDFAKFREDMGDPLPGMSIDRINNGEGYSKANCRWASAGAQAQNRRSNKTLTLGEKTLSYSEWSRETGIKKNTISYRVTHGWPVERVLGVTP